MVYTNYISNQIQIIITNNISQIPYQNPIIQYVDNNIIFSNNILQAIQQKARSQTQKNHPQ
ncbi:hypothetical protein pb186bvf_001834 [Paramecium bursaria]